MSAVGLTFEADGHRYAYDGTPVASVTQVLAPLHDWGMVDRDVLERAAKFGNHVHAACHLFNQDSLDEESLDPALGCYLDGYKKFLRDTGFRVGGSEVLVYHNTMRYAGQYDFHGQWKNSTWVVDIKTCTSVPSTVGYQLAAYQAAMQKRPRNRLCLQLMDGDYRLHICKKTTDFNDFVSILNYRQLIATHNPRSLEQSNGYSYPN